MTATAPAACPRSWIGISTLAGSAVTLRPFRPEDADALYAARDDDLLRYLPSQWSSDAAGFRAALDRLAAKPDLVLFTVADSQGRPCGVTSYLDIRPADRTLEIGHTWISREHQGTRVNPEMKCLLLAHAFDALGCMRVQLVTDLRNLRSQRAIEKLGAVREGVTRCHRILPDGHVRSTVQYGILDAEWPEVRARLRLRLARTEGDQPASGSPISSVLPSAAAW